MKGSGKGWLGGARKGSGKGWLGGGRVRVGSKGFGSGGVSGRGTGPRDGANFATCVVFLLFLTRTKKIKLRFLKDALWEGGRGTGPRDGGAVWCRLRGEDKARPPRLEPRSHIWAAMFTVPCDALNTA